VFARDQARAAARSAEVTVLVHDPGPRRAGGPVTRAEEEGLRTIRLRTRVRPASTLGRIAFLISTARELRALRRAGRSPDVIHAHVYSAGLVALLAARGRYPVVLSEHHTDFIEERVKGRDARIARYVFRHAELVCPVSERLMGCLKQFEPAGRYEVVPNVVDVEPFLEAAEHRAERSAGPPRLLVVAGLTRQKGLEYLLQALGELSSAGAAFTLDVLGEGPERGRLESLARERRLEALVQFHGARPRAEVASYMARSDVLVMPSVVETFGIAVVEALAVGLPVIATTALPDHRLVSDRGFGLIVPPADPSALRDALARILDHGWTVPADAAANFVRSFSPQVVAQRWAAVYRSVARAA
jgi:glycosyltransferase involved in cell wall biosynthesis